MFFAPSKLRWRAQIWIIVLSKTSDHIPIKTYMPKPSQEPLAPIKHPVRNLQCPPKTKSRPELQRCTLHLQNHWFEKAKIQNIGLSKTTGHGFGTLKDAKLFWDKQILLAREIWIVIQIFEVISSFSKIFPGPLSFCILLSLAPCFVGIEVRAELSPPDLLGLKKSALRFTGKIPFLVSKKELMIG